MEYLSKLTLCLLKKDFIYFWKGFNSDYKNIRDCLIRISEWIYKSE
jgi:hypothetical protein